MIPIGVNLQFARIRKGINQVNMDKLLLLQQKIAPEIVPLIRNRYQILHMIHLLQPIGRRALADQLRFQERMIRNEIDVLRSSQLIACSSEGMSVTPEGEALLTGMTDYIRDLQGLNLLEQTLMEQWGIPKVIVVPGDSDQDESVKKDLARLTAEFLLQHLQDGAILAVAGGTTLAGVGSALMEPRNRRNITVIPAQGGLGEEVEIQANTVAANIAKELGANYRLLHVPDDLRPETIQTIAGEPKIKELLDMLRQADMFLHGIGAAEEMARRRGMPAVKVNAVLQQGAVGEAFGYYFAADGRVVHSTSSVGLQLAELALIKRVVAVAGGASKAAAVRAVLRNGPRDILIIDEGAAREIVGP